MNLTERLERWMDETNNVNANQRRACSRFANDFRGFYTAEFLERTFFVVTEEIPRPDFEELWQLGLGDFLEMPIAGITYKNTYYLRAADENNLRLHFHELVHVAQWELLGGPGFIERYIHEIQSHGYHGAPLEAMAHDLDRRYATGGGALDVVNFVRDTNKKDSI